MELTRPAYPPPPLRLGLETQTTEIIMSNIF